MGTYTYYYHPHPHVRCLLGFLNLIYTILYYNITIVYRLRHGHGSGLSSAELSQLIGTVALVTTFFRLRHSREADCALKKRWILNVLLFLLHLGI